MPRRIHDQRYERHTVLVPMVALYLTDDGKTHNEIESTGPIIWDGEVRPDLTIVQTRATEGKLTSIEKAENVGNETVTSEDEVEAIVFAVESTSAA